MIGVTSEATKGAIEVAKKEAMREAGWIVIRLKNGQRILAEGRTTNCLMDCVELHGDDASIVVLAYSQIAKVEAARD